jgi:electron-transferring-flavoprotein dehydrogenase
MEFDVLIVGGGPSGLAAAIRLKQLNPDASVCLVEKGSEIGAHILSGAVLEPRALDELIPDWRDDPPALATPATDDRFMFLTATKAFKLPTPPQMNNHGNYIVSLGNVCRWLARRPRRWGSRSIRASPPRGAHRGWPVRASSPASWASADGEQGPNYQPGVELRAAYTLFAEGCRGSLTKTLFERFGCAKASQPQTFGLGIKELWEIPPERTSPG